MMKVFNSICTGRVGVGAWYRPLSVFSISFFFSVCSMTMILCDFSLKCYCTNFGKIWWYLVWTQGYWPWLNTHFKNKCNFWSNPHKMEITLFLLQCMILGIKLSFIAIIQTEWRINSSEVTSQPEIMTCYILRNLYFLPDWEQAYCVHQTKNLYLS